MLEYNSLERHEKEVFPRQSRVSKGRYSKTEPCKRCRRWTDQVELNVLARSFEEPQTKRVWHERQQSLKGSGRLRGSLAFALAPGPIGKPRRFSSTCGATA